MPSGAMCVLRNRVAQMTAVNAASRPHEPLYTSSVNACYLQQLPAGHLHEHDIDAMHTSHVAINTNCIHCSVHDDVYQPLCVMLAKHFMLRLALGCTAELQLAGLHLESFELVDKGITLH